MKSSTIKILLVSVFSALLFNLSACGKKSALSLPDQTQKPAAEQTEN